MEMLEIVGRKHVNFTDDSGKAICGWSYYYLMNDDRAEGKVAGKFFVSDERSRFIEMPEKLGKYEVSYDRYGRPSKFVAVG